MSLFDFQNNPIILNVGLFVAAAVVTWLAGTRISRYADRISYRTGLDSAFVGLFFLALATETPEIATTITASVSGNAELAINNIFGGVTLQTVVLAIVDLFYIRGALTFFIPEPGPLIQGVMLVLLLTLAIIAVTVGELIVVLNVGLWSVFLVGTYFAALYISNQYQHRETWSAENAPSEESRKEAVINPENEPDESESWSLRRIIALFAAGTGVILVAGFILARTSEALAEQSGLGASFVGATLLASATSLPELSTTITSVRLNNHSMAFANIFGSNSIMLVLIFVSDVFYRDGPILQNVDKGSVVVAGIGTAMTCVYLVGMLERNNRTVFRMGLDSAVVIGFYVFSLITLYQLR